VIRLYHWEPNGESLSLLICLHEVGLAFEGCYVDMLELEQHGDFYRSVSPQGDLPLLLLDGAAMTDSSLALQYLAEAYPTSGLRPEVPADWYDLQARMAWLDGPTGLASDIRLIGWNRVMLKALPAGQLAQVRERTATLPVDRASGWSAVWADAEAHEDQLANALERVQGVIIKIERALSSTQWLAGDSYSAADIGFYGHLHAAPDLLPEFVNDATTPAICDWLQRIRGRAAACAANGLRKESFAPVLYAPPGT